MKLSELIKKYCDDHNMSYRKFADRCGVSNGYITMLINERNPKTGQPIKPQLTSLSKIAAGMGISTNDLLNAVDEIAIDISQSPTKQRLHELIDTIPEKKAENLLQIFLNILDLK